MEIRCQCMAIKLSPIASKVATLMLFVRRLASWCVEIFTTGRCQTTNRRQTPLFAFRAGSAWLNKQCMVPIVKK